eukprot:SAG11_NODE_34_length_22265_cov_11.264730_20_plen_83_part_00
MPLFAVLQIKHIPYGVNALEPFAVMFVGNNHLIKVVNEETEDARAIRVKLIDFTFKMFEHCEAHAPISHTAHFEISCELPEA